MIENRFRISLDLTIGSCRLDIQIYGSPPHVHFDVFLNDCPNFSQIDVSGLTIEVERRS